VNAKYKSTKVRLESGAAMLIAIFALLLVSVVAIALIVSSGTDTTLAGNYRTSTSAYYAGLAGLEEGRGRLLWRNPDFINNNPATPNFVPILSGATLANGQSLYILNPANGETVAPWDTANLTTYPDLEYTNEYPGPPVNNSINSTFATAATPGPLYKWVRITPATEASLGLDVDGDGVTSNSLVYYDPINTAGTVVKPSLVTNPIHQTARQAIEITTLAVLPNNTLKMMQYIVAPLAVGLYFHSGLEMPATSITFAGPTSTSFQFNGNDGSDGTGPLPIPGLSSCAPNGSQSVPAVGVTEVSGSSANYQSVINGIPPPAPPPSGFNYASNYMGTPTVTPSIQDNVYVNPALSGVQSLSQLIQTVTQNADVVLSPAIAAGTITDSDMAWQKLQSQMSATNPMTVVVNGNLTISTPMTGYGLLLVTGNFVTNADVGWRGIVMVVGTGNVTLNGGSGGSRSFIGNFFVAQIYDPSKPFGTLLPNLGAVNFNATNASGLGIYRNSCWINAALLPASYKILSFREIPYP
jgi:hypothetical protein